MQKQKQLFTYLHSAIPVSSDAREADPVEIWDALLKGDEAALASLYSIYVEKLYVYGFQITKDEALVQDAIQDVFIELLEKRQKLGKARSPKHYLIASLRRKILRQISKNKSTVSAEVLNEHDGFKISMKSETVMINQGLTEDQKLILVEACNRLPFRQREIINLYFFEEMSYAEITEIMGFEHIKSTRTLLYRSLQSMYDLLKNRKDDFLMIAFIVSSLF
ncbi:MAG: sigma-70 family RNA polymerase sigma factor [Cyclobacteriaceae bacterium]|nr:sigma-70 family RNA polymerase sigma factor [Cyclobacteriaceae bacterium]